MSADFDILPWLDTADAATHMQAVSLCQKAGQEIRRLREIEAHARRIMELLDDGGPEQGGAHLIDSDDNPRQRLRQVLGGFD